MCHLRALLALPFPWQGCGSLSKHRAEDVAGHGAGEQAGSKRRYNADTVRSVGGVGLMSFPKSAPCILGLCRSLAG